MILEQKTFEKFGYTVDSLTAKSSRSILLQCDYCGVEYESIPKRRFIAHKVIAKDACSKCKYIKMEEMNLLKYGVKNVFQLDSIKEKSKVTCKEKYGTEFASQSEEFKEKVKETCLDKYGVQNACQSEEVKTKMRETLKSNYGVENPSLSPEIVQRRKETMLDRFGHVSYLASEDCKQKRIEKLGTDNIFRTPEFVEEMKARNIEKYGVDHRMKVPELAKAVGQKSLQSKIESGKVRIFEGKTASEWAEITGFSESAFHALVTKYGWDIAVDMTPRMSSLEIEMGKILDDLGAEYKKQVKVGGYYTDFVIGDIIIECDGLYWHSENHKNDNYHIEKLSFYEKSGYRALFFRQDEILNKRNIVKSIIANKLGMSKRIFARKCSIGAIDKNIAAKFLSENHLMGKGRGEPIALIFEGEILAVFQVCKTRSGWELSRFATKSGTNIIGGFSKALSFFINNYRGDLVTFVDRRYGSGDYLPSLGFTKESSYASFRWTDGTQTFHRMRFKSNTGYGSGLYKIWDCGQTKYLLRGVYSN
jgi:very-short-patch-repair endonuclease